MMGSGHCGIVGWVKACEGQPNSISGRFANDNRSCHHFEDYANFQKSAMFHLAWTVRAILEPQHRDSGNVDS